LGHPSAQIGQQAVPPGVNNQNEAKILFTKLTNLRKTTTPVRYIKKENFLEQLKSTYFTIDLDGGKQ
jgi:hypothetical protein